MRTATAEIDRAACGFFRRPTIRVRLGNAFLAAASPMVAPGPVGAWQLQQGARRHADGMALALPRTGS